MKNMMKNMKKKKKPTSVGEERISKELQREFGDPTLPSYRFYGVKRRVHPKREKFFIMLVRGAFLFLVFCFSLMLAATAWAFFFYFPEMWLKLLVGIVLAILISLKLTQNFRRRRKCKRKLIKTCQQTGVTISFREDFLHTRSWNGAQEDFRLETDSCVYYGHYMGVKKYGTKLYLESKGQIKLNHQPIQSFFTIMFDVTATNVNRPITTEVPVHEGKKVKRVLLIHPNCDSIWYKKWDGGYESMGDGGEHFGLTVYTVLGLCEAIKRNAGH